MSSPTNSPPLRDHQPTLVEHHCLAVTCTLCAEQYDDEFTHHFASISEALTAVTESGWLVAGDTVLCHQCVYDSGTIAPMVISRCEFCLPPLFSATDLPTACCCRTQPVTHIMAAASAVSWTNPGFTLHHCLSIQCGDCGAGIDDDDESVPHYRSQQAALGAAGTAGWLIALPHLIVCRRCANRRSCTALGHSWPEHPTYVRGGIEYRCCLRDCDEIVQNPESDRSMPWL